MKWLTLLGASLLAAPALAASTSAGSTGVDVQHFKPTPDGRALLTVDTADVKAPFEYTAGLALNYSKDPLVLRRADGTVAASLVGGRLDADLLASVGLTSFLEAGLDVPIMLSQSGDANAGLVPVQPASPVASGGLGDLRAMVKAKFLDEAEYGLSLAFIPALTFPTGKTFAGSGGVTFTPALAASKRIDAARLAADVGFRVKPANGINDLALGNELTLRAGAGFDLQKAGVASVPVELLAEVYGATQAGAPFASKASTPLEGVLGARYSTDFGLGMNLGFGRGLDSGYGTPTLRVFAVLAFSPPAEQKPAAPQIVELPEPPSDRDGDGVDDAADACPDVKGLADAKGCPPRPAVVTPLPPPTLLPPPVQKQPAAHKPDPDDDLAPAPLVPHTPATKPAPKPGAKPAPQPKPAADDDIGPAPLVPTAPKKKVTAPAGDDDIGPAPLVPTAPPKKKAAPKKPAADDDFAPAPLVPGAK